MKQQNHQFKKFFSLLKFSGLQYFFEVFEIWFDSRSDIIAHFACVMYDSEVGLGSEVGLLQLLLATVLLEQLLHKGLAGRFRKPALFVQQGKDADRLEKQRKIKKGRAYRPKIVWFNREHSPLLLANHTRESFTRCCWSTSSAAHSHVLSRMNTQLQGQKHPHAPTQAHTHTRTHTQGNQWRGSHSTR